MLPACGPRPGLPLLLGMAKRRRIVPANKMSDIAKLAGVHSSTVSRALAGSPLVAKKKRDLIIKLAREQGYVVNPMASNLRLRRTQTISVVIPLGHETGQALSDPFFVQMLGHLADEIKIGRASCREECRSR